MRNHLLDLLKLTGIILVAFHHTAWTSMKHGYLPVEFFFIVSGYFIFRTFQKVNMSAGVFMWHKFKRIAPTYYLTLLLYVCLFFAASQFYPRTLNGDIGISLFRDALCLQATGILDFFGNNFIRFNPHDWYVSAFLYGGLIVYLILKTGKYAGILLAVVVVMTYSSYFLVFDIGLNDEWGYVGFMYLPLWRGMAGMAVGALCAMAMASVRFSEIYNSHIHINNLLALLSLTGLTIILFIPDNHNFISILLFIILLLNVVTPAGLSQYFQGGVMKYIPDISLEILLMHKFLIIVTVKVAELLGVLYVEPVKYLLYVIILISGGMALKFCTGIIESGMKLLKRSLIQIAQ